MSYTATSSIDLSARPAAVWDALVNPEKVRQYLFGTTLTADWKVGGYIRYSGEWEGKAYEDKGTILEYEPEKILKTTYFSSASGLEDKPENYNTVTYAITPQGEITTLTITQDNIKSEEARDHSQQNWTSVLAELKKLLED